MGNSAKYFRYFSKRPPEIITQHLVTLVGILENGETVAYAHLDPDDGKVWLGICVAEAHCGKGFGETMISTLLEEANKLGIKEITLSVDEDNLGAIKLYEKSGFIQKTFKNGVLYFVKGNGNLVNRDCCR